MDLWILKQDKTHLKKVQYEIQLGEFETILVDCQAFGVYDTKERAMEVLDEIQKLVNQNVMYFVNSLGLLDSKVKECADTYGVIPNDRAMGEIKYISPNSVVYEMPQK